MDCNENADQMPINPAPLVSMTTGCCRTWNSVAATQGRCMNRLPTESQSTALDNSTTPLPTDLLANVKEADDNDRTTKELTTWKDLSPTHSKVVDAIDSQMTQSNSDKPQEKVLRKWGQRSNSSDLQSKGQGCLMTWKQVSPTNLSKNAFGFSSPESSDSDTLQRNSSNGIPVNRSMQDSSSDASACSPTHGARGGAGSDGSSYLGSPDDGFNNDYFYDEDFSVKFDTNLKDSLVDVPSEGVSSPSILEFSDTMTINLNETSSTIDGSLRASQYDSMSDQPSVDMSTSDRDMVCSSDLLQISDGPLFTPTPTNELPHNISTDSLDKGLRCLAGSVSTDGKALVDCGTRKELYMLSFFNKKSKQTTSMASVASQASWSSGRSNSNCTSQEELEGSVSASLQTHLSYGRSASLSRRKPAKAAAGASRSRSESNHLHHAQPASDATSSESLDGQPNQAGRLTSWRNVKQRRKLSGQSTENTEATVKSKSMPDLYMQNWLEKMSRGKEDTESQSSDMANSSGEQLKGSATSLMEMYQKLRPDRFSDENLEESRSTSAHSKDSVFSEEKTVTVKDSNIQAGGGDTLSALPPRFYNYSSESEASGDMRQRKACHSLDRKSDRTSAAAHAASECSVNHTHTVPRAYKQSLSSPARCGHICQHSRTLSDFEKETQCPPLYFSEPVTTWKGTKNFSAQFPPNTRDCGIQASPDSLKSQGVTSDKEMQTSPAQPHPQSISKDSFFEEVFSPHRSATRLSRSANVQRPPQKEFPGRCGLLRPHSIGAIGEEGERRFPTYDAVVTRSGVSEKRGASLSPNRPNKQSFYSHRSLPDLSFLTSQSPPTTPLISTPDGSADASSKPVFFIPKVSSSKGSPTKSPVTSPTKIPQSCNRFRPQPPCFRHHGHLECLNVESTPNRNPRAVRATRKSSSGHAPTSASSSSGFSTSSTSSGIDPGYHDNRHSPPTVDQMHSGGCHVWDNRHKFIETDGGCVYYHSLPNHLPPVFISEEEKMDFYSCMCVKPTALEAKMFAYKYEPYPENHQHYFPSKSRQGPSEVPAQDGGQELIPEEQSTSSGMGTTDDIFSIHENDQSSSPDEGSRHETNSHEFCGLEPSAPPFAALASNGVVLRRGKSWQNSERLSSGTDSPRGSSDNLSGSSGEDRKPLKSCLRRRRIERHCRSMSLTDPFRLYEGYFNPQGPRRASHHRHSYGCDGYPLYMNYMYEEMDTSDFGDMMEWYRATYLHDARVPLTVRTCSCSGSSSVPSRQESQPTGEVTGENADNSSNDSEEDGMDKKEKRKSVSFASEVSFHSPLPSPQCSPKRQSKDNQDENAVKGGNWDSNPNTLPGVPVPQLSVNVTSDEETDASCSSDVAPSEFSVMSPRGLSDSHNVDSVTACIDKKKKYLNDVTMAADSLVRHFSQSKEPFDKLRLGNSVDTPEICHLVMSQLCPAIARVISDGLKPYMSGLHVFGRIQITVWRVAEMSAELGPSTRAIYELVKDLRNRSDLSSTRQKFEAFVFGLLNLRLLDFWMGYMRHKEKVLEKLYEGDSIVCMSHDSLKKAYSDMLVSLQPLAVLPFQLDACFIVAFHSNRLHTESYQESGEVNVHGQREVTPSMNQSQPPSSTKVSWSWFGGSVTNTLPRAKSLMSNMAQKWSPTVTKLHNGAVRSLTMFSSSSSTSSCATLSQDHFEQALPRNKGELFIDEGKIRSIDSSCSESSRTGNVANGHTFPVFPPEVSDEDSQTESSHGMSRFAAKIFNMASGKIDKITPANRKGVTDYYFEGDSDLGGSPKVLTPGTDTSSSTHSPQSPVSTWSDARQLPDKNLPIPPPKPPRSLHNLRPEASSSSASAASSPVSPSEKTKKSFGLIKLFDKLLLPATGSQGENIKDKKGNRWSWTPLGSKETNPNVELDEGKSNSLTTFKSVKPDQPKTAINSDVHDQNDVKVNTENNLRIETRSLSSNLLSQNASAHSETLNEMGDAKTVKGTIAEAKKLANQITLQDGPVLTLPPSSPPKTASNLASGNSACYAGIVQSDTLTLSISSPSIQNHPLDEVDRNANFVNSSEKLPLTSCAGYSNGGESSSQTHQSEPLNQTTNQQQCTSSHVPTSSANQLPRTTQRGDSSSESDQSKCSSMDQSDTSSQTNFEVETKTEEFKLPTYRYVETVVENLSPDDTADHMTFTTGEYLEVLAQLDADWLFCANGKKEGKVSRSSVRPVTEAEVFNNLHSDFYQ